ncbi:MAG TPA: hypothetical protein VIC26_10010 [Marinagarivorans sp.]
MNKFPVGKIAPMVVSIACLLVGAPQLAVAEQAAASTKIPSVEQLLDGLRKRLEANPQDVKGWVLLAKSYDHVGRWHEAEKAAAKARALGFTGEILSSTDGKPRSTPVGPVRPGKAKMHHHHNVVGSDAGSYVSSFFEQQGEPLDKREKSEQDVVTQEGASQ